VLQILGRNDIAEVVRREALGVLPHFLSVNPSTQIEVWKELFMQVQLIHGQYTRGDAGHHELNMELLRALQRLK